jgi:hypothetical protein
LQAPFTFLKIGGNYTKWFLPKGVMIQFHLCCDLEPSEVYSTDPSPSTSLLKIWDRCYVFKNIFAEKIGEKMAFFAQTTAGF